MRSSRSRISSTLSSSREPDDAEANPSGDRVMISIVLQFVVVLAAIWMGARSSGVGLGLWGAVGLLALVVGFGVAPTSPPIDVMLIILAVIMAASVMDAAGGIDFLVRIAERVIRAN